MVMEDPASTTTTSTSTSTVVVTSTGLPRVPSSPLIASGVPAASEASEAAEVVASKATNNHNEAEDAFATSGSRVGGQQQRLMMSSSYYRHPSRRERSLSSITSPYTLQRGQHNHQRSSSAILDLEYASLDSKAKRRSLSTCAGEGGSKNQAAPPAPSSKMEMDWSSSEKHVLPQQQYQASNPEGQKQSSWRPKSTSGHSHVRFEETPSKCHHLLSEESDRWTSSTTQNQPLQPQVVQRTQSNPEMELCPVCLARKECEILLKRTYSKRGGIREKRKHSDPNIPRSATSDADSDAAPHPILDQQQSGSSSTSSLSARSSLDSPATSMQDMAGRPSASGSTAAASEFSATTSSTSVSQFNTQSYWDSDFETEPDPPDWRLAIHQEELNKLNPRERKRQDVINEFFHTEKSHVRTLKVLDRLFFRPLIENSFMSRELVDQLFPNLEEVLAQHNQYNQKMKERAKAGFPVGNIGDMLCEMFEGTAGEKLIQVSAEFTKNQKFSIEELKERRKRDHKLDLFLNEQRLRPECRRLGLEALLPVEHQRLVKYPLLLEQLAKQCDKESEEYAKVRRCVDRSREILDSIDKQVAEAQNIQRLAEIQRNLDTSGLEKMAESPITNEYRNLDLTKHRLIYDGPLTMKLGDTKRFKTIDLHVLLLEDCIMLLQKQDDKYLLKFHTSTFGTTAVGTQGHKFCHSPVIKFATMLVRPVATDKRAFYLLNTTQNGPQIYELVASSTADRTQWFRHIQEASNAYRVRDPNRRSRYPADPLNGVENSGKTDDHLGLPDVDKKGQPAGRSQSFHESSTSSRELHSDRQPSSPPEERGGDSHAKKAGEDTGINKRFQRVEILKIAEPCPLIDPSQVVVTQGEIMVADPVLSPIEKIRRKDLEVARALEEKHRLVSEYYQIPFLEAQQPTENNSAVATIAAAVSSSGNESEDADANRDAREVLLAALVQVKSLSDLVNESLTLSEEDAVAVASTSRLSPAAVAPSAGASSKNKDAGQPASEPSVPSLSSLASEAVEELPSVKLYKRLHPPTHKLIAITKNMNQHLTSLLEIIQDRDEERERLRKELSRAQDQVHTLLSQSSVRTSSLSVTSPASRPASFISIEESSGPETSERNQESEDDGASITTIPTTQKSSDTDDTSITVAKEIEIPIEVEKSNKPLNGEEVTLPTPEPSSPNETSELSEPESKSTVIDTDETTKNSEEDDEEEEADKTIDDNTEDDSAV